MGNKAKRCIALLLAVCLTLTFAGCGKGKGNVPTEILNGDFEDTSGQWVGWTKSDAAFSVRGVVSDETMNGAPMEKSGEQYFSGAKAGNPVMVGTLTSDIFKLGGNGFITFKIGAGKNPEKCYVEFIESGTDTVLAKVANTDCDGVYITEHLLTKVVDLSAHIGKNIYIRATDNDDGNEFAYLNLDAFHVCQDDAEVEAAKADYSRQIEAYGEKPFEEDPVASALENGGFETGDLTGWKILEGTAFTEAGVVPTSQYYWGDRSVYGEGDYYFDGSNNGATAENLTGAMRSQKFTLGGDGYISFMIGAGNGNSYVALCDDATGDELIKVQNTYFNDPALALTLLRVYMDAHEYLGKVVYLKVVDANDGSDGGFAFINVDDFRVSLTTEEVAALEVEQMEKIQNETYTSATYDDLTSLRDYYSNYPYPVPLNVVTFTTYAQNQVVDCGTVDVTAFLKGVSAKCGDETVTDITVSKITTPDGKEVTSGFDAVDMKAPGAYTVTYAAACNGNIGEAAFTVIAMADHYSVANGGFESGNLAGWTVLTDGWSVVEGQAAGVINATTWWGEELPYNQAGNYHLDGWNTGIEEQKGWRVKSTVFTLSGSGYISVRMGGAAAAVYVYRADGTEIGYYKQTRFNDVNFPHIAQGGSWADMGTYVMDLSAYKGQSLYIVLADEVIAGGWAHAFFDEVVTYYATIPNYGSLSDTVTDGHSEGETPKNVQIPWRLAKNLAPKPFVENPSATTIQNGGFETGDLSYWKVLSGSAFSGSGVVSTSQYYWTDRSVYGDGRFYFDGSNNGATAESLTGAMRSQKFTLAGDGYISFMMGCGSGGSYVALCDGATDRELIKVENTYFNDPALPLTLLRMYMDAHEYIGKVVYLKVVDANDGSKGGFAFINVDDFRVSLTREAVAALELEQMEKIQNETYTSKSYDDLSSLRNYYSNYPYPVPLDIVVFTAYAKNQVVDCGTVDVTAFLADAAAKYGDESITDIAVSKVAAPDGKEVTSGFDAVDMTAAGAYTVTYAAAYGGKSLEASFTVIAMADHYHVPNGSFESGNLAGWTVLTDGWSVVEGQAAGVINATTWWVEELPYNQAGSYHLDGWNTGIGEPDGWSVRSANFILSGSGFISLRMGGAAAAVHVYKADGTEIGYYKQTRFNDSNFPHIAQGGSWADMGTYVMDLSDYIDEELYIVLTDEVISGGWAHAFFDEVVTYYETAPDYENLFDTVIDGHTADETPAEVKIPWQLATNLAETPPVVEKPGVNIVNGGFETGDLTGWTVLTEGWKMVDGKPAGVISADKWWGEELPYNQAGSYHLDGWETGIEEANGWQIKSSNFTLGGSGFISLRMGGAAAAVHVYKADGTEIGYYKQTRFKNDHFPHIAQGGSWADMGTYVIDLSDYIGEELYIVLADEVISGGWAHAFFDEVVTYYETAPDYENLFDTVIDGHTADETPAEVKIPWQLAVNLK